MSGLSPNERITRAFLRMIEQAGLALGGLNAAGRARAALETALAQGAREPLLEDVTANPADCCARRASEFRNDAAVLISTPIGTTDGWVKQAFVSEPGPTPYSLLPTPDLAEPSE